MLQRDIMFQQRLQQAKPPADLELISRVADSRTASMRVLDFSLLETLRPLRLLVLPAHFNQLLAKLAV
jgi:hypothetical protein